MLILSTNSNIKSSKPNNIWGILFAIVFAITILWADHTSNLPYIAPTYWKPVCWGLYAFILLLIWLRTRNLNKRFDQAPIEISKEYITLRRKTEGLNSATNSIFIFLAAWIVYLVYLIPAALTVSYAKNPVVNNALIYHINCWNGGRHPSAAYTKIYYLPTGDNKKSEITFPGNRCHTMTQLKDIHLDIGEISSRSWSWGTIIDNITIKNELTGNIIAVIKN